MRLIAPAIPRLLGGGAVIAQTVGFDDQPQVGPEEVHLEPGQVVAGPRRGKAGAARDRQEAALELRVGEGERAAVEDFTENSNPRPPRDPVEREAELLRVDEVALVGLVDGSFSRATVEAGRDVDQRTDRGRHRNTLMHGHLSRAKRGAPVNHDAEVTAT